MSSPLSPALHPRAAIVRDRLLRSAEQFTHRAEQNELRATALRHVSCRIKAAEGTRLANLAKFQRGRAQQFIAQATDLTDYTHDLDRQTSGWALLTQLCNAAEARALSDSQVTALSKNPNTLALA